MKHILNVVKTESPQRRLKPDTNISTKMCKIENEIITVRQSSGLASCFSTILYFYIKAKEEFNNFVFALIDGAEAELLEKKAAESNFRVYDGKSSLYHTISRPHQKITTKMNAPEIKSKPSMQTYCILIMFDFTKLKKIQSARPHIYGLGYPSQPSPRVTRSELTFHLFLYKVQPTVYMRL